MKPITKSSHITIIGSGITGLVCAAILSKQGYKVSIFEKHKELIGGHARTFKVGGIPFCAGPQFLWNMQEQDASISSKIIDFLGLDDAIDLLLFNPKHQDRIQIENEEFVIPAGISNFEKQAIQYFPNESKNISTFFSIIYSLFRGAVILHDSGGYLKGKAKMVWDVITSAKISLRSKFFVIQFFNKTLEDLYNYCEVSNKARRYLYAQSGVFAENEERSHWVFMRPQSVIA